MENAPNPRPLGALGGPQGAPGPFPSRPRLGTSGGPRRFRGSAALGALRGPRGPEGLQGTRGASRTSGPGPGRKGPLHGPGSLWGAPRAPGAKARGPLGLSRPGSPPGGLGAPRAALGLQGHGGPSGPPGGVRSGPPGGLQGTPGLPREVPKDLGPRPRSVSVTPPVPPITLPPDPVPGGPQDRGRGTGPLSGGSCPLFKSVTMAKPLNSRHGAEKCLTANLWVQMQASLLLFKRPCTVTSTIIDLHRRRANQSSVHGPDNAYRRRATLRRKTQGRLKLGM
jgi:hypothetical protein